ncbi:Armadillo repeat-containing protein 12 [Aix galericulata]|nr:Armadillo repeat-containing protein 12 [Aix galericulata]
MGLGGSAGLWGVLGEVGAALCWPCLRWPHPAHAKGAEPLAALPVCPVCPVSALGGAAPPCWHLGVLSPEQVAGLGICATSHGPAIWHMSPPHDPSPCPVSLVPFPASHFPFHASLAPCHLSHASCPMLHVPFPMSLVPYRDGRSRSAILRSIARCIHLMDTEVKGTQWGQHKGTPLRSGVLRFPSPSHPYHHPIPIPSLPHPIPGLVSLQKPTCSPEHIELVASCLDDHNRDTKIQALNTLRAFVTRSRFTDKVRDYYPKILDMVSCSRDMGVQLAVLQLLNALPMLLLLEVLHGGCTKPRHPSKSPKSDSCSLYEVLFGENSNLGNHLMVMFVHPDLTVQVQACKLIMKLQLHTLNADIAAALSKHSAGSAALNHILPSIKSAS